MTSAPPPQPSSDPRLDPAVDRAFFGHPKGLLTLFFTEMWERFSFYGMRAILMLFMTASVVTGGLGFPPSKAGPIYALYTSMVYLATVPGGWLADNFLGARKSVFLGGVVIMVGHILLALHGMAFFYGGLACVVVGTGLLKPCISAIVGDLYSEQDARRDAGFSIFYMGINIGAWSSPLVCGWLAQSETFRTMLEGWGIDPRRSWHWGFGAAAVGMFFGLVQYILTGKHLGDAGLHPTPIKDPADARRRKRVLFTGLGSVAALAVVMVAYNTTAKELESPKWKAEPSHVFQLTGYVGAEALEFPNRSDLGELPESAEQAERDALEAEKWVDGDTVRVALGPPLYHAVEAGVAAGRSEGTVDDLDLEFGTGLFGEKTKLDRVEWVAKPERKFAITGTLEGEEVTYASDLSPEDFAKEIGEERMESLRANLDAGETEGALAGAGFSVGGLDKDVINKGYTVLLLGIVIGLFSKLLFGAGWTRNERARLVTIFVLFLGASVFWGVFEQAGSTLTLFADRSTNNSIFGMEFPASWWQSVNAFLIIVLSPVFAWMWVKLSHRAPSDPAKFAIGLFFVGLGFFVLVAGAMGSGGWQRVSPMWLFSVYLFHTIGELCLSPVGLSSMTKLAPARVASLMMGVWFLAASVGNFISGSVAGFYEDLALPRLFAYIALGAGVMSFVMFLLVGPIKKMLARSQTAA